MTYKSRRLLGVKLRSMKRIYNAPIGLTVDNVIFTMTSDVPNTNYKALPKRTLCVLLVKRAVDGRSPKQNPYQGYWAFPGGFTEEHEIPEQSALRELDEEANVGSEVYLRQLGMYYQPNRDPRGWIPTAVYTSFTKPEHIKRMKAGSDASEARLFSIDEALQMELAFDHSNILLEAYESLQSELWNFPIIKEALPESFSVGELYNAFVASLPDFENVPLTNFRTKVTTTLAKEGVIEELVDENGSPKTTTTYSNVPARLYRFIDSHDASLAYQLTMLTFKRRLLKNNL